MDSKTCRDLSDMHAQIYGLFRAIDRLAVSLADESSLTFPADV